MRKWLRKCHNVITRSTHEEDAKYDDDEDGDDDDEDDD